MTLLGPQGGCRDGIAVLDPLISHIMNLNNTIIVVLIPAPTLIMFKHKFLPMR
ncbi:hypothetical protein [Corynebacterium rouxii]|uniref:Uncharacterized protein n=1 Tax=Corynebacterium rouxii TaxID=2719119 RepID=A0ABU3PKV1_9CORY|nr:hypothetical protein [Corynebacterium rouxii]MDT9410374.1 hypothetical protein [Corynebacterium rouxii]